MKVDDETLEAIQDRAGQYINAMVDAHDGDGMVMTMEISSLIFTFLANFDDDEAANTALAAIQSSLEMMTNMKNLSVEPSK